MGASFRKTTSASAMKGALASPRLRVLGLLGIFLLALFVRLPGLDRPAQLSFGPLYQDELKMLTNTVRVMKGISLLPHWPYGIYRLMAPQFQATRLLYTLQCGHSLLHPISVGDLRRLAEAQLDRFFIIIRAHALILGLGIVFLAFVLGAAIGGGLALLTAPRSGEETRDKIHDLADETRDKLSKMAEDAEARVKKAVDDGKELLEEKKGLVQAAFKAGREAMEAERSKPQAEEA